jgi:hypothetical protein
MNKNMLHVESSLIRVPILSGFSIILIFLSTPWPYGFDLSSRSTRNLPECKGRPENNSDNLTATCEPNVYKMWDLRRLPALYASTGFTALQHFDLI